MHPLFHSPIDVAPPGRGKGAWQGPLKVATPYGYPVSPPVATTRPPLPLAFPPRPLKKPQRSRSPPPPGAGDLCCFPAHAERSPTPCNVLSPPAPRRRHSPEGAIHPPPPRASLGHLPPPPPSLPAVQHTLSSGGTLWLVPPSIATARCLLVSLQWGSGEETGPDVASGSGEGQRGHGKIYIGEGGWLQASVAAPLAIGDQLSLTGLRCCQPFRPSHPPPPLLLLLLLLVLGRMLCSLSLCFPAPTPLSFCCSGMHAFAQLPPPPPNLIHSITWV